MNTQNKSLFAALCSAWHWFWPRFTSKRLLMPGQREQRPSRRAICFSMKRPKNGKCSGVGPVLKSIGYTRGDEVTLIALSDLHRLLFLARDPFAFLSAWLPVKPFFMRADDQFLYEVSGTPMHNAPWLGKSPQLKRNVYHLELIGGADEISKQVATCLALGGYRETFTVLLTKDFRRVLTLAEKKQSKYIPFLPPFVYQAIRS